MKQFIAQFRLTGRQWLALACVGGMFGLIAWLSFRQQRLEYGRDLDVKIDAAIQRADHERQQMAAEISTLRRSLDALKGEVKEIRP